MAAKPSDKGRRVRILAIGGLVAALAIAGFFAYRTWWASSATPVTYVTTPAAKTTLISSVSGTGNAAAGSSSSVAPTISGTVSDLKVQLGDTVAKGQLLFTLVNPQLDLDVTSAEATYQQSQERLNTAELAVLQAEQSLSDLEDQQDAQSAGLPTSSAVVLASYSPAPSNAGRELASAGNSTTTVSTGPGDSTTTTSTTTSTTSTTLPPTTLPPTTLPPTTFPPTTGPPVTAPPTTSTPPTSFPGGGGGATTPTTAKTVTDLDIAVAEQKVASAKVDVTIAQSNLDSSEYALTQAKADAAARTVLAPTDGTVTALNVSDGDEWGNSSASSSGASASGGSAANAGSGGTGGTASGGASGGASTSSTSSSAAVVVTDLNSFEVTVSLGETDVTAVTKGDKATLTFDALPDLTLTGTVDRVASIGTVTSGVVSYDVTVVPSTGNEQVRAGMTSTANIITESKVDALAVPSAAVKTDQSGTTYVLVLKNGAPVQQTVQTGMTTDAFIEVTSGLTEGQAVVTKTVGGATTATTARAGGGVLGGAGGPPGGFPAGGFPGGGN